MKSLYALALASGMAMVSQSAHAVTVVDLTQTGCQFVESENGVDHKYSPKTAADCVTQNNKNGKVRLGKAKVLKLKPGEYIFRVRNKNVPYVLGFWLREHDYQPGNPLHRISKTSVSGGGIRTGQVQSYKVTLKAGTKYIYSCPLNPTPDYSIVVN